MRHTQVDSARKYIRKAMQGEARPDFDDALNRLPDPGVAPAGIRSPRPVENARTEKPPIVQTLVRPRATGYRVPALMVF